MDCQTDIERLDKISHRTSKDDSSLTNYDRGAPEAPKMIVFATLPHLQTTRISSYSEAADRSEHLRRYNLNDIFSTSMLLTSIRDIPLEPPSRVSSECVPSWKLIRPKKSKILPHAELIGNYDI